MNFIRADGWNWDMTESQRDTDRVPKNSAHENGDTIPNSTNSGHVPNTSPAAPTEPSPEAHTDLSMDGRESLKNTS